MARAPAIGIDLGTTYASVGVFQNGRVEIIRNRNGDKKIPSYIAFTDTDRLIGHAAKNHIATINNPKNIIFDAKRLVGRKFDDRAVQIDLNRFPFHVISQASKLKIKVVCDGEQMAFHPEEISSMILRELKETAEAYLKKTVTDAVISVPAHFNDSQRQATIDAGTIAGLNVLGLINEPSAASLAYGLHKRSEDERHVLIFDLGAGSLDVSVLKIKDGIFKVKSTAGDPYLGGHNFDGQMIDYFIKDFKTRFDKDLSKNIRALLRLRVACEKAKRSLSSLDQASIEIDSLHEGIDFYTSITRTQFEELNSDLFLRILEPVQESISNAKMVKSKIDDIVLVGGCTRIPKIRQLLRDFFEGKELGETVNADEAVAFGAAVQAAIKQGGLSGQSEKLIADTLLIDVLSSSLCVVTTDILINDLIIKNTTIPVAKKFSFFSGKDIIEELIRVYEGEKVMDVGNNLLGNFDLKNISLSLNLIDVEVNVDANGVLSLNAVENDAEKKLTVLSDKGRLSANEIKHLIEKAEKNRIERMEREASIAAKNSLKSYCFNVMKTINNTKQKDKISESIKKAIFYQCGQAIRRFDPNQFLRKLDFEYKQKELAHQFDAIILELQKSNDVPAVPSKSPQTGSICEAGDATHSDESRIQKEVGDSSSACDGPKKRPIENVLPQGLRDISSDRDGLVKQPRYSDPSSSKLPAHSTTNGFHRPAPPQKPTLHLPTPPLSIKG